MYVDFPPVFTTDLRFVPDVMMVFFALQKIAGGIGGLTSVNQIISRWAIIRWERDIFHDIYEVNLGLGHLRCDCLEGFQGDVSGY